MKKKVLSILLTLCIVLSLLPPMPALAANSGTCGAEEDGGNVTWTYDSSSYSRTLTIRGNGPMADYTSIVSTPWFTESPDSKSTYSLVVEEGVTTVGDNCFFGTSNYMASLSKISLPSTITSIGEMNFSGLSYQVEITFAEPSQLKTIGDFAFYGSTGLGSIDIPDGVTIIGSQAFATSGLTSLTLPEGVTSIGAQAFAACWSMTDLFLPASLQTLADSAFTGCTSLANVTFNGTRERWETLTAGFSDTHPLKTINVYCNGLEPDTPITYTVSFAPGTGSGTMEPKTVTKGEDNVVTLPECAFSAPDGYAFGGWNIDGTLYSPGDEYTVAGDVTFTATWDKIQTGTCGDVTWTIAGDTLTISGNGAMADYTDANQIPWRSYSLSTPLNVVIGEGVTKIGVGAFLSCRLKDVTIAGTVRTIPFEAFTQGEVKSITLQPGVETIARLAFHDCNGLTEISIPATVKNVGENAVYFSNGTANTLATVNFGGTREQWDSFGITQANNAALYAAEVNTTEGSTYKITFEPGVSASDPNVMPAVFVAANSSFTLPENKFAAPTGMHFTGWQIGGEVKAAGTVIAVAGPVTVTAQWANNRHKMTFQAGGGSGTMAEVEIEANTSYIMPACGFAPPVGKRFTKWELNGAPDRVGDMYEAGASYPVTGDAIATAHWENKPCTITFVGGDSEAVGTMEPVATTGNSTYKLPICTFTVPGKQFYRWLVNGVEQSPNDVLTITDDITVTALWTNLYTITFQAGEGSGTMPEAAVADGSTYQLPDCAFTAPEDKRFQAWQINGQSYAPSQKITVTEDLTVTALWASSQIISFDANGGSGTMADVPYTRGMNYVLPECGFTPPASASFKAWLIDGQEYAPGALYPLQTGATVRAVWLRHCTVTLNPNATDATVSVSSISADQGQKYGASQPNGELPRPIRAGYGFTGWFTAAEGGYLVQGDTPVTQEGDHTLYAHWSVISVGEEMSYSFANTGDAFGYRVGIDRIPYSIFVKMFGDTPLARFGYEALGTWQGSCYGMATSSAILSQPGSGVTPGGFKAGAGMPFDLKVHDKNDGLGIDVQEFVEMMMASQFQYIKQHYVSQDLTEIFDVLKEVQEGKRPPVEITIDGFYRGGQNVAHAVTGVAAEEISEMVGCLYIYDGNYPHHSYLYSTPRRILLYRSTPTGPYTHWYYSADFQGAGLSYIDYEDFYEVWNNRADKNGSRAASSENTHELLMVNSGNVDVYDASGTKVAYVKDGKLITEREDISQLRLCDSSETSEDGSYYVHDTAIWLPVGLYTVVNQEEKSGQEKFQATMVHVNQAAQVAATGDTISFLVDDNAVNESSTSAPVNYVRLAEPDADYEITLSSSLESTYSQTKLTGTGDNKPVAFAQIDSQLHTDGVDLASPEAKIETRQPDLPDAEQSSRPWTPVENTNVEDEMPDTVGTKVKKATMTFDANGGSGSMDSQTATIGTFFVLPRCEFTAPGGKEFDCWAVGSLNSETKKQIGESFLAQEDTTLYPLWKNTGASSGGTQTVIVPSPGVTASPSPSPDGTPSPSPDESPSPSPDGTPTPPPDGTPSPSPEPWKNPFPDVKEDQWYIKAVEYVCVNGLMAGYKNGKFGPSDSLTRAQFAQILYSKAGKPAAASGAFTDVKDGQWYANAVNWAAAQKIVAGIGNGKFAPGNPITREQLAIMLWRYAGSPEPEKNELDFRDAGKISKYAWKALCWASENGIVSGKGGGILDPRGIAKRSEAAQMLMKYFK